CGAGRAMNLLAETFPASNFTGFDLCPDAVEAARTEADRRGLPCVFHRADAFDFVAERPCDAAVNWFTSFGYADDDRQNARMLQRAFDSLKSGGRFALELANYAAMLGDFRSEMIERPDGEGPDGVIILHENKLDLASGSISGRWTFVFPDGSRRVRDIRTRMYMPHEITSMFEGCGFVDIELFGSTSGEPMELKSSRCIVLGRRP
ncbi:MAG: class I SAM-dependent methyltransferase, partial [Alteromonas sp.]|nr:class I SAM-dependent methyltransferase [Alteromonas sp.]